jgi:hypothetical protein
VKKIKYFILLVFIGILLSCNKEVIEPQVVEPQVKAELETLKFSKEIKVYADDKLNFVDYVISSNSKVYLDEYIASHEITMKLGHGSFRNLKPSTKSEIKVAPELNAGSNELLIEHLGSNWDGLYSVTFLYKETGLKSVPTNNYYSVITKEEYMYVVYTYVYGDANGIDLQFSHKNHWLWSWHCDGWEHHYGNPGGPVRLSNSMNGEGMWKLRFEIYSDNTNNYTYLYGSANLD